MGRVSVRAYVWSGAVPMTTTRERPARDGDYITVECNDTTIALASKLDKRAGKRTTHGIEDVLEHRRVQGAKHHVIGGAHQGGAAGG